MYGYYSNEICCGFIVLNTNQPEEYRLVEWKYIDQTPLVLHRLCIEPEYQNRGIGRKLIEYAENYAVKNKYKTIRFDAFIENHISNGLYKKMGYWESGIVKFRKGQFNCFEKEIIE